MSRYLSVPMRSVYEDISHSQDGNKFKFDVSIETSYREGRLWNEPRRVISDMLRSDFKATYTVYTVNNEDAGDPTHIVYTVTIPKKYFTGGHVRAGLLPLIRNLIAKRHPTRYTIARHHGTMQRAHTEKVYRVYG